jgi:hypothetical protein
MIRPATNSPSLPGSFVLCAFYAIAGWIPSALDNDAGCGADRRLRT